MNERVPREIDAEVAEKVIGWREITVNRLNPWITVYGCKPDHMPFPDFWKLPGAISKGKNGEEKRHVPPYSTDISAAMEVRDVVAKWPFSERLIFKKALRQIISARLGITSGDYLDESEIIFHVTAKDICLAAVDQPKESIG